MEEKFIQLGNNLRSMERYEIKSNERGTEIQEKITELQNKVEASKAKAEDFEGKASELEAKLEQCERKLILIIANGVFRGRSHNPHNLGVE